MKNPIAFLIFIIYVLPVELSQFYYDCIDANDAGGSDSSLIFLVDFPTVDLVQFAETCKHLV